MRGHKNVSCTIINRQKRIGEILTEAHIVTPAQLQVALYDQQAFSSHRIGEILVIRGWIDQQTADFFADQWRVLCNHADRQALGSYFKAAGLLTDEAVQKIVHEQQRNGYRFGANAVLLGFIHQETLNYFLEALFPDQRNEAPIIFNRNQFNLDQSASLSQKVSHSPRSINPDILLKESEQHRKSKETIPPVEIGNEVEWVG